MKVKKILLSIILAIVAIILVFNSNSYAESGSWTLGVEKLREGKTHNSRGDISDTEKYFYTSNTIPVLKIVDRDASDKFAKAIYCLRGGQGFGSDESRLSNVTYDVHYDMLSEKSSVEAILHLNSQYGSVFT